MKKSLCLLRMICIICIICMPFLCTNALAESPEELQQTTFVTLVFLARPFWRIRQKDLVLPQLTVLFITGQYNLRP